MIIYIDNYKGFTDTFVKLMDVNFLVGENSTGKSALLNLIELVTSPHFWLSPGFNSEDIELGYFSEIVKQNSKVKNSFSIGVLFDSDKTSRITDGYMWLKFVEKEQTPVVSECRFISKDKTIWCKNLQGEKIACYEKLFDKTIDFQTWIKDTDEFDALEAINIPEHSRFPFGVLRSLIENQLLHSKEGSAVGVRQPIPLNRFYWISPIRAKAKRWYESYKLTYSPEGEHIPIVLKKYLSSNDSRQKKFVESMNEFGRDSHLFDKIEVRNESNDAPFSLCINYGEVTTNISNVGYGVSQVLPLVVEMLSSRNDSFAIQQPEVHLHPLAQAAFGKFVYNVALNNHNRIILETHSDYLINRFRYSISQDKQAKITAQVLFFERDNDGTHIKVVPIDKKGKFAGDYVSDYMKFYVDEELKMLEI